MEENADPLAINTDQPSPTSREPAGTVTVLEMIYVPAGK